MRQMFTLLTMRHLQGVYYVDARIVETDYKLEFK